MAIGARDIDIPRRACAHRELGRVTLTGLLLGLALLASVVAQDRSALSEGHSSNERMGLGKTDGEQLDLQPARGVAANSSVEGTPSHGEVLHDNGNHKSCGCGHSHAGCEYCGVDDVWAWKSIYEDPTLTWYAAADGVALNRDAIGRQDFASLGSQGEIVLNSNFASYQFQGGVRGVIGWRFADGYALEGVYLNQLKWDDFQDVRDVSPNSQGTLGNLFSPFTDFGNPPVVGLDFNTLATIHTVSKLKSCELNLVQHLVTDHWNLDVCMIYGARYVKLDEQFQYHTESNSPAPAGGFNTVDVGTGNELIGFQIGSMAEALVLPRCWVHLEIKLALCHNDAEQNTVYTTGALGTGGTATAGGRANERTALLGDLSLSLSYAFTTALVGRIGYQAMALDGVALAAENFSNDVAVLTLGPAGLNDEGSVIYHGPFAGLMYVR